MLLENSIRGKYYVHHDYLHEERQLFACSMLLFYALTLTNFCVSI
jgi:hypothetical protein